MVSSAQLEEVVRSEAADRFRFLIDDYDYDGPETTSDGLTYHGQFQVSVGAHSGREPEVSTLLTVSGGTSTARLSSVYVHLGLGPAQDVPEGAQSASGTQAAGRSGNGDQTGACGSRCRCDRGRDYVVARAVTDPNDHGLSRSGSVFTR